MGKRVERSGAADLKGSVSAFGKVAYQDLLSITVLSIFFTLTSLPLVTLGASLLAITETMTEIITREGRGAPTQERARVKMYLDAFRQNLRRGLPFSVLLGAVTATTSVYLALAADSLALQYVLGVLVGLYSLVIATVWSYRAASLIVRAPAATDIGFIDAMRDGAFLALERPYYTVLQLAAATGMLIVLAAFPIAVPLLLPALLATLEVVSFEELAGDGALDVVYAYRGEFREQT